MSYVFFDTETTGLDSRFDQILQFAAILTDENLNELDRINYRCRVQPHIIPSATALAISDTSIATCMDTGLPSHYEMISEVYKRLRHWSPAIFSGWNSIRFDEEFLRHAFYQCLHPSFLTSLHGNSRLDILSLAQSAHLFAPNCLKLPLNNIGKPTFALEGLAKANGFDGIHAHDALSDVQATIYLARLLKERAPNVWSQGVRFAKKQSVQDFFDSGESCVVTESYGGYYNQYPVTKIGADPNISAYIFAADLSRDYSQFKTLGKDQQLDWISIKPQPIRRIKSNASPMLMPFDEFETLDLYAFDELLDRGERLRTDPELCTLLSDAYYEATFVEYSNDFVEQQLYGTFADTETEELFEAFQNTSWEGRSLLLSKIKDHRYKKLGLRIVHEHAPYTLSNVQLENMNIFIQAKITGSMTGNAPWRTISSAKQDLKEARLDIRFKNSNHIFDEYEAYLSKIEAHYVT